MEDDKKIYHNIGILAHVDSGKTTLTGQILYLTGAVREAGSVDAGNAVTDNLSVEQQRGISVRSATASCKYNGVNINIIDTPGHVDFAGEVERCLAALDYAVVLVSAVEGVRSHTENILHALDKLNLPRLLFINKIDRAGADSKAVLEAFKKISPASSCVMFSSVTNEGSDAADTKILSGSDFDYAATEALAEINPTAEEAYLTDETLTGDTLTTILKEEISSCRLTPVLCGSAKTGAGIHDLIDFLTKYMPDSTRRAAEELSGIIFKIEHDKQMGKISHIRLFGGKIENRDELLLQSPADKRRTNPDGEEDDAVSASKAEAHPEKVVQIRRFTGGKYTDAGEVAAGDIGALCGLPSAKAGQFVGSLDVSDQYKLISPFLRVKVTPQDKAKANEILPNLAHALSELSEEEPYIDSRWERGQDEITISTTGKVQLEVLDSLLRERYNIAALFSSPTVIYKETPASAGIAYADYTMPKPCWAVVQFKFEPMPRGYGVSYHGKLPSNQLFYRYQSHIRTSFYSCLEQGLYGWEVTDFKCTLVGGQHHTIHTHPLDFFVCTPMAFMNGLASLGSTILEPLLKMRITAQANLSGKIITEISRMGGEYDSPLVFGDTAVVEAIVPAATSMYFPERLASMSSGRAVVSTTFHGYRECRDGLPHVNPRRGVNPLDRSKWILWARGAYQLTIDNM